MGFDSVTQLQAAFCVWFLPSVACIVKVADTVLSCGGTIYIHIYMSSNTVDKWLRV